MRETGNQIAQAAKLVNELETALSQAPERVSGDVNMINNPVARALDERIGLLTVEPPSCARSTPTPTGASATRSSRSPSSRLASPSSRSGSSGASASS